MHAMNRDRFPYQILLVRPTLNPHETDVGDDALSEIPRSARVGAAEADVLTLAAGLGADAAVGVEVDVADELVGADPEAGRVDHVDKEGVLHGELLAGVQGMEEGTSKKKCHTFTVCKTISSDVSSLIRSLMRPAMPEVKFLLLRHEEFYFPKCLVVEDCNYRRKNTFL